MKRVLGSLLAGLVTGFLWYVILRVQGDPDPGSSALFYGSCGVIGWSWGIIMRISSDWLWHIVLALTLGVFTAAFIGPVIGYPVSVTLFCGFIAVLSSTLVSLAMIKD